MTNSIILSVDYSWFRRNLDLDCDQYVIFDGFDGKLISLIGCHGMVIKTWFPEVGPSSQADGTYGWQIPRSLYFKLFVCPETKTLNIMLDTTSLLVTINSPCNTFQFVDIDTQIDTALNWTLNIPPKIAFSVYSRDTLAHVPVANHIKFTLTTNKNTITGYGPQEQEIFKYNGEFKHHGYGKGEVVVQGCIYSKVMRFIYSQQIGMGILENNVLYFESENTIGLITQMSEGDDMCEDDDPASN